jgi:hypothetical protein
MAALWLRDAELPELLGTSPSSFSLAEARALRVGTPTLNRFLKEAMIRRPPPSGKGVANHEGIALSIDR